MFSAGVLFKQTLFLRFFSLSLAFPVNPSEHTLVELCVRVLSIILRLSGARVFAMSRACVSACVC